VLPVFRKMVTAWDRGRGPLLQGDLQDNRAGQVIR
jgi:hypothetical protein